MLKMGSMAFLEESERLELKAQHRLERDGRIRDRIKAVLLYDKGWSWVEIADALLITEGAVRQHVSEYQTIKKLGPNHKGSQERFSLAQEQELIKHLESHTYLHVKEIAFYVCSRWDVKYTVSGMTKWLKRHGFSYKKPALVPGKVDAEKQRKWIEEYQKLKARLPENEAICFTDGVHPTHNVQLAYGWIKKGVSREIPSNTGRSRINLAGAIDIQTHDIVLQEDKTLNADATVRFFKKIEQAYPGKSKVHIFCDNAGYYRNQRVTEYLENSIIELHFLPPYSPNLNPIERLWKWMKEKVVYNTYYEEFADFRKAIIDFFSTISGLDPGSVFGQQLRSRVTDNFRVANSPL
jgi:transposase